MAKECVHWRGLIRDYPLRCDAMFLNDQFTFYEHLILDTCWHNAWTYFSNTTEKHVWNTVELGISKYLGSCQLKHSSAGDIKWYLFNYFLRNDQFGQLTNIFKIQTNCYQQKHLLHGSFNEKKTITAWVLYTFSNIGSFISFARCLRVTLYLVWTIITVWKHLIDDECKNSECPSIA